MRPAGAARGRGRLAPLPSAVPAKLGQRVRSALAPDAKKMLLDASVPGPIRRNQWWAAAITLAMLGAMFAFILLDAPATGPASSPWAIFGPMWLGAGVLLLVHRQNTRTLRRAAAHNYVLCPECLYDLRTLDAAGACPECGRAYEHGAVRAQWLDAARRLTRK